MLTLILTKLLRDSLGISTKGFTNIKQKTDFLVWSLMKEAFWILILRLKVCPQRAEHWSLLTGDRWSPPWFGLWALPTSGPLRQNLAETSSPRAGCSCLPHKLSVSGYLNTEQPKCRHSGSPDEEETPSLPPVAVGLQAQLLFYASQSFVSWQLHLKRGCKKDK